MGTVSKLLLLMTLFISANAFATFLPPNNLHLQDKINARNASMTEKEFSDLIDAVSSKLESVVAKHGGSLVVEKNWDDSTVNAYAEQRGNTWSVAMFGGLARRPEVTPDGFQMVVCHELGHHLGGFPFYSSDKWAAVEGESDYFATQACAKLIWGREAELNSKFRALVDPYAKDKCDEAYKTDATRDLCYRTAAAGQSLANLLAALGRDGTPQFNTPDQSRVTSTQESHPEAQCRLDTYLAGALCNVSFDFNKIPGKNYWLGANSKGAEKIAAKFSCTNRGGNPNGKRPACWFKPRL
jgi:hypothetical protein